MESEYASWMDRFYLEFPGSVQPDQDSQEDLILQAQGAKHERALLQELGNAGHEVVNLKDINESNATLEAMKSGREIIYQAGLSLVNFAGFADFLVRVAEPSVFGHYSYEVWDTKLARKPKPYFAVQLCCYSEMLAKLQQRLPKEFCVVLGTKE